MSLRILILLTLLSAYAPLHAALSPEDLKKLPPATIEAALPNEHPSAYYGYAARLFREGKKDEAVFWFYVGQLRYRFHLKPNGLTSKKKFATIYEENRAGLKKMRDQVESHEDSIREQRKKAGLENRG